MVYDRWTLHIEKVTSDFLREFAFLQSFELNLKPTADSWSIGQIIDHIIVFNSSFYPLIDALKVGVYKPHFIAKIKPIVKMSGERALEMVDPDRYMRIKTNARWNPVQSTIDKNIFDEFELHQASLKQVVADSYYLLDSHKIISSPANRLHVYKLSTAFDVMINHERRHLEQARQTLALLERGEQFRADIAGVGKKANALLS